MTRKLREIGKSLRNLKVPAVSRAKMTVLWLGGAAVFLAVLAWLSQGHSFPLLQTRGDIANRQRDLLLFATMLALLVLVPVYFMMFVFAWRYRAGHKKSYAPEWDTHKGYEALWWGIPIVIITVLAVVTWNTSHSLDPFKPLTSTQKPLQIQVVALQWKWLFIYPEEQVASVGEVAFPAGRPVEFTMTSDAPMNSFWIPQLAGQIYVMSGMSTKLHVVADTAGTYKGMSSNVSGKGFADMKFNAKAMGLRDYESWVATAKNSGHHLTMEAYDTLAQPSTMGVTYYHLHDAGLYDAVVQKYMGGGKKPTEENLASPMKMEGM